MSNKFNFWNDFRIMNTSGLLQSNFARDRSLLQSNFARDRSIHDSMNIPKIEFIS